MKFRSPAQGGIFFILCYHKSMDKARFLRVYANLPIKIREQVVLVIDDGSEKKPISWNVAYVEIENETALGKKIFDKLVKLELI